MSRRHRAEKRDIIPDPKFGKNGVVDLMDGLGYPLVLLAVDDSGSLVISDAAPADSPASATAWASTLTLTARTASAPDSRASRTPRVATARQVS